MSNPYRGQRPAAHAISRCYVCLGIGIREQSACFTEHRGWSKRFGEIRIGAAFASGVKGSCEYLQLFFTFGFMDYGDTMEMGRILVKRGALAKTSLSQGRVVFGGRHSKHSRVQVERASGHSLRCRRAESRFFPR